RHTRSKRDWSSDVCSSDLAHSSRRRSCYAKFRSPPLPRFRSVPPLSPRPLPLRGAVGTAAGTVDGTTAGGVARASSSVVRPITRSEERRVGKGGDWGRGGG